MEQETTVFRIRPQLDALSGPSWHATRVMGPPTPIAMGEDIERQFASVSVVMKPEMATIWMGTGDHRAVEKRGAKAEP